MCLAHLLITPCDYIVLPPSEPRLRSTIHRVSDLYVEPDDGVDAERRLSEHHVMSSIGIFIFVFLPLLFFYRINLVIPFFC